MTDSAATHYTMAFSVSWEEFHRTAKLLAWRLYERRPFDGVIAITRGGLVPAAIIARELEIRTIETVGVASYVDNTVEQIAERQRGDVAIIKAPNMGGDGGGWLVVDDLADTGETARAVRAMFPQAHFAALYAKPAGREQIDTYVTEVSQDTWIHFPWDLEPRPTEPIVSTRR